MKGGGAGLFNTHETSDDKERDRILQQRLETLKRAREHGYFDEEGTEKVEVIADGRGPDDGWLYDPGVPRDAQAGGRPLPVVGERNPNPGGNMTNPYLAEVVSRYPKPTYTTSQYCARCDGYTRHNTYGRGFPTWHCNVCCLCEWCLGQLYLQTGGLTRESPMCPVHHEKLMEAVSDIEDNHFFCTHCGAMLRCTTCMGEGTGDYCDLCGQRIGDEGYCTDCWSETEED